MYPFVDKWKGYNAGLEIPELKMFKNNVKRTVYISSNTTFRPPL